MKKKLILSLIFSLGVTATTAAGTSEPITRLDPSEFTAIVLSQAQKPQKEVIKDFSKRADFNVFRPQIKVKNNVKVEKTPILSTNGSKNKGIASWYCNSDDPNGPKSRCYVGVPDRVGQNDYFAAVRRDMLFLRGKTIQVCTKWTGVENCIPVKVIDCNCGEYANLIDLYADAFAALFGDIGKGRRTVRIYY